MTSLELPGFLATLHAPVGAAAWPPWQGMPEPIRRQATRPIFGGVVMTLPRQTAQPIPLQWVRFLLGFRSTAATRAFLERAGIPIVKGFGAWAKRDCIHLADYWAVMERTRAGLLDPEAPTA